MNALINCSIQLQRCFAHRLPFNRSHSYNTMVRGGWCRLFYAAKGSVLYLFRIFEGFFCEASLSSSSNFSLKTTNNNNNKKTGNTGTAVGYYHASYRWICCLLKSQDRKQQSPLGTWFPDSTHLGKRKST